VVIAHLFIFAAFLLAPNGMAHAGQPSQTGDRLGVVRCESQAAPGQSHGSRQERQHSPNCAITCSMLAAEESGFVAPDFIIPEMIRSETGSALAGAEEAEPASPPPRAG
jgi:hypothetical protein